MKRTTTLVFVVSSVLSLLMFSCGHQTTEREKSEGSYTPLEELSDDELANIVTKVSESDEGFQLQGLPPGLAEALEGELAMVRPFETADASYALLGIDQPVSQVRSFATPRAYTFGCYAGNCPAQLALPANFIQSPAQFFGRPVNMQVGLFQNYHNLPLFLRTLQFGFVQPIVAPVPVETYQTLHCASGRYRYQVCGLQGAAVRLDLIRKVSRSGCSLGHSFGLTNGGTAIWVNHGCRADFRVTYLTVPAIPIGF